MLSLSHDEAFRRRYPIARCSNPREYDARAVRDTLLMLGGPTESVASSATPTGRFDTRWIYWEAESETG